MLNASPAPPPAARPASTSAASPVSSPAASPVSSSAASPATAGRRAPVPLAARVARTQAGSVVRVMIDLRRPLPEAPDAPTWPAQAYAPKHRLPHARPPMADVYLPDGPGPHPSVLWVHGGGFTVGRRHMKPMQVLATACRRAGYAVATIDYRLLFRGGRLAEGVADVSAAWRWWQRQAGRYRLDPSRAVLGGLSAGGCLALLAAEEILAASAASGAPGAPSAGGPGATEESHTRAPVALISAFALYDVGALNRGVSRLLSRLVAGNGGPAARTARSPQGRPPLPLPLLALHGDADAVVPVAQAHAYLARRTGLAAETRYLELPGVEHAFFNNPEQPAAQQGTQAVLAFLARHLGPVGT